MSILDSIQGDSFLEFWEDVFIKQAIEGQVGPHGNQNLYRNANILIIIF